MLPGTHEIITIDPFLEAEALLLAQLPLFSLDLAAAEEDSLRVQGVVADLEDSQRYHLPDNHVYSQEAGTGR
jgi:hypothetical protein